MALRNSGAHRSAPLRVEDETVPIPTGVQRFNFTGAGVKATQKADGLVEVAVQGTAAQSRIYKFTGDGAQAIFTLPEALDSGEAALWVSRNGLVLERGGSADYTATQTTITFAEAPADGAKIAVRGTPANP